MSMIESIELPVVWREKVESWLKKFPKDQKRSALLYALRVAQEIYGWLDKPIMVAVARYLDLPEIYVYEVATFYTMYDLKPTAKYKIGVCTSISCYLCGSDALVEHLQTALGIGFNEATPDGLFYLQRVECLAACVNAPALIINDRDYYTDMTTEKIDELLAQLKNDTPCEASV